MDRDDWSRYKAFARASYASVRWASAVIVPPDAQARCNDPFLLVSKLPRPRLLERL